MQSVTRQCGNKLVHEDIYMSAGALVKIDKNKLWGDSDYILNPEYIFQSSTVGGKF